MLLKGFTKYYCLDLSKIIIKYFISTQAGFSADGAGGSGLPAEGTAPSAGR